MEPDNENVAAAIKELTERLLVAKDAELTHLREINSTLTGIGTSLSQIADLLREKQSR